MASQGYLKNLRPFSSPANLEQLPGLGVRAHLYAVPGLLPALKGDVNRAYLI